MTETMTQPTVHIRWMIARDLEQILPIDQHGTGSRWTEVTFRHHLRQSNTIGMVAEEASGEVVGYMVYRLTLDRLELFKLAVRREVWGNGYGGQLLEKLVQKIRTHRRPLGVALIPEHNLPAHLLFRSAGWACTGLVVGVCLEFIYANPDCE